ncbi:unnamed protein product [Clonostachys solani]|uniref:Dienelactone hydrolase domain-containing protein n=1 Tax=Clonostachys solani TaxID=160281 RepID=A0A9N9Z968_9HYPO|nr:unnamed protein product [Clonostachys solani]
MSDCCLRGFQWDAQPAGHDMKVAGRDCYVTGSNPDIAIIILHDLFGWTFKNTRILADQYAEEVGATVYIPDLFGGEVIPAHVVLDQSLWASINLPSFLRRNSKAVRGPEIVECATLLRARHSRIGVIGFCYGGWGAFRLGSRENALAACIVAAHPTQLEKAEIENVGVPVQVLAPQRDPMFTEELKAFSNQVIPTLGVAYDYQYFPGVEHGFAVRGSPEIEGERRAMERAKNAAVLWFRQWLK